jgi:hypothetical protein
MNFAWSEKLKLGLVLAVLGALGQSHLTAENTLSADQIIQKAVARAQCCEARPGKGSYTYTKLTVMEEFDSAGKVKERKQKVYQVNFRNGATYAKLVEVNGRPPADADLKKQAENESNARQMTGNSKSSKSDNRENFLTPDIVSRFDFTLIGQTNFNGRATYQVAFHPKNPAPPGHHMIDRLLDRMSGLVLIDAQEFEIARAELHLGSEVNLLGGVVGSLRKLVYTMTCTRIDDGLWFKTSSFGDFEGRKLIDAMRIKTSSQAINFRRLL